MDSLWTHGIHRRYPSLRGNIQVDVAIVGAGLSGIGAAYALRNSGLRTTVLEARTVASGASGRNAGFLLAGPAMPYSEAVRLLGSEQAKLLWSFTVENNESIDTLIRKFGIHCGYIRRGSLSLAASESELGDLLRSHADLTQHGISCCLVSREFLPQPFDRLYRGGLYYPGNGELDPATFVSAVAEMASETVMIYEESSVAYLEQAKAWRLATSGGSVEADIVLLCTNAFTSNLLPEVPIESKRGQVLATSALSTVRVPFPMYADNGFQYWRQTPEGRMIVGGWRNLEFDAENSSQELLNPSIHMALDQFLTELVPGDETEVEYRWAGVMGFTPDRFPLVGSHPTKHGVYMAAGYSGHGVSMAFTCGARLALIATGKTSSIPVSFLPSRLLLSPSQRAGESET